MTNKTLLCFGDSITYGFCDPKGGWADRLKQYSFENRTSSQSVDVYNLGVSGATTKNILETIENETNARRWFYELEIILAVGINDTMLPSPSQKSDLAEFKEVYSRLITLAKKHAARVYCLGLTPVDETKTNP